MDVLDVLEAYDKQEAERWLTQLNIETTEYMKENDFKKFVDSLRKQARMNDDKEPNEKLDRGGLEKLRRKLG